jgi:metal-responsive CopG/Arc/MetJ family transcriptional regulator
MAPDLSKASPRLDPSEFPRRIEVELSDEVVQKINTVVQKTGRSFSEVATDILSRQ